MTVLVISVSFFDSANWFGTITFFSRKDKFCGHYYYRTEPKNPVLSVA